MSLFGLPYRLFLGGVWVLSLFFLPGTVGAAQPAGTLTYRQVLQEGALTKVILDNGLTVVLSENHAAPVAAFQMWVRVGSRNE